MKALIQWARNNPSNWEWIDTSEWSSLPRKGSPSSGSSVNASSGWISALNIQGLVFEGADKIAVLDNPDGSVDVWLVNNDPRSWGTADRYARHVTIHPLQPDSELGGAVSTKMVQTIYTDSSVFSAQPTTTIRPWASIVMPDETLFRYGVMMNDTLFQQHQRLQTLHGWREWSEGVGSGVVDNEGRVLSQRSLGRYIVPKGTRTYYMNNQAFATGIHNGDYELELGNTPAGVSSVVSGNINANGSLVLVGTSPANEPDSTAWPTGNYRYQLDVASVNSDITYGLLAQGTVTGHFSRVDSGLLNDLETKSQAEAAFSFPGLRLATTGSVSWTAGNASDRFEVAVAVVRASGHGNATITFDLGETDDFADGPWPAATGVTENSPFFGANF